MREDADGRCRRVWSPQERVSQTCRCFRTIVHKISSAWTDISVGWWIEEKLLESWLDRAAHGPFEISFPSSSREDRTEKVQLLKALTSVLLKRNIYIRGLYLERTHSRSLADLVKTFLEVPLPSLDFFHVICTEVFERHPLYRVPQHRKFAVRVAELALLYFSIVPPPSVAYDRLETLILRAPPGRDDVTFIDLCNVVSHSPVLNSLTIDFGEHDEIAGLTAAPVPAGRIELVSDSVRELKVYFCALVEAVAFMERCKMPAMVRFGIGIVKECDLDDLDTCLCNVPLRSLIDLHITGFASCSRSRPSHILNDCVALESLNIESTGVFADLQQNAHNRIEELPVCPRLKSLGVSGMRIDEIRMMLSHRGITSRVRTVKIALRGRELENVTNCMFDVTWFKDNNVHLRIGKAERKWGLFWDDVSDAFTV